MKKRQRSIRVNQQDFLWSVKADPVDPVNFIVISIWRSGQKAFPWLTIRYHFHNYWLFYGDLIAAQHYGRQQEAVTNLQMQPVLPGCIEQIIARALTLPETESVHSSVCFYLDDAGALNCTFSTRQSAGEQTPAWKVPL